MYPFYSAKKMRVYPFYMDYLFNIHADNGVLVLPDCFNERNILQIGTQTYPFYSTNKMHAYPFYRNYPYDIHVDGGVPALQDC